MRGWLLIVVIVILNASLASAAVISGSIYDLNLNKARNVVVTIDTVPHQTFVAKEGFYTFTVPRGDFIVRASNNISHANESITIKDNAGSYTLDLILFPDIEEEQAELSGDLIGEEYVPFETKVNGIYIIITILAVIVLVAIIHFSYKQRSISVNGFNSEDADLTKLVAFIRKENGRTTQKDIRKAFNLSEAKISLMITELEHDGVVEKIKKGRGNVIIMKK